MLVGGSGAGKSWWSRRHFLETEVVSSDRCRALVCDDETNQAVNREAFAVFYAIVRQRLSLRRLTVADSTALQAFARQRLAELAAGCGVPAHAVLFATTVDRMVENNLRRERRVPDHVVLAHARSMEELTVERLAAEGFAAVHRLPPPLDGPPASAR